MQTKQLVFEIESWKRIFDFMENETVSMKGQLGQILKEYPGDDLLNQIEQFQNQFLTQDKLISIFRNDLEKQSEVIRSVKIEDSHPSENINKQQKLRKEIHIAFKQFEEMKSSFYHFFCERFSQNLLSEF
jgi:hypothetical protein